MRSNEACASGDEGALLMCHLVRITTANAEVAEDTEVRGVFRQKLLAIRAMPSLRCTVLKFIRRPNRLSESRR